MQTIQHQWWCLAPLDGDDCQCLDSWKESEAKRQAAIAALPTTWPK